MGTNDDKDSNSSDAALFREAIGETKPLKANKRFTTTSKPRPKRSARAASEPASAPSHSNPPALSAHDESDFGRRLLFKKPSVSRSKMRELTRGKLRVDAAIDLHGLRADRARRELDSFLTECLNRKLECVRIVHGKGYGSGDRGPVLKTLTREYLSNVDTVLAFSSALDKDGGTGAVYVLLDVN
jgi:DNA-nicking Smr family endonuclease